MMAWTKILVVLLVITQCCAIMFFLYWMRNQRLAQFLPFQPVEVYQREEANQDEFKEKYINISNETQKFNRENDVIDDTIWQSFSWNKVPEEWMSVINRRKRMLQDRCHNCKNVSCSHKYGRKHILVEDKHKLILCALHKAASRSWGMVYGILSGQVDPSSDLLTKKKSGNYTQLFSFDNDGIRTRLRNYLKVMVVRHPLERIVSAYKEQVREGHLGPKVKAYINLQYNKNIIKSRGILFSDLLQYIVDKGPGNNHWSLMDSCKPCFIEYDIIVHHETLQTDAANLFHLLDVENLISQFPQSHRKVENPSNQTLIQQYYDGIDQRLGRQVSDIYKEDASCFGYKLDL